MKKIFNSLAVLLLITSSTYAQQPQNRTTATKIADVLAQQPAKEKEKFLLAMNELEGFSSDDIVTFLKGLKEPGSNNAPIEFAANSYSFFVNQPGKEQQKKVFIAGLTKSLSQVSEPTNQAFVLRLLRQCADDTAVTEISTYLADNYLVDAAARALVSIGTNNAALALQKALSNSANEKNSIALITALGDLRVKEAENPIIDLTKKYTSESFQRSALIALSKIGGTASASLFQEKLNAAGYHYDANDAVGLGIDYAQALIDNKHEQDAVRFLNKFFEESKKTKSINGQIASLQLLTAINPAKQQKNILSAVKSDHSAYRNVALQLLNKQEKNIDAKKLLDIARKSTPDVQESILNYLSYKGSPNSSDLIKQWIDKTTLTPTAKLAGLKAIDNLSQGKETSTLIESLGTDQSFNNTIKTLILANQNPDAINDVNKALANVDDNKKIQLLDILSKRSNTMSSKAVLAVRTSDPTLEMAVNKALPNVAQDSDLNELLRRLEDTKDEKSATLLQQAIVNVIQAGKHKDELTKTLTTTASASNGRPVSLYFPIFAGLGDERSVQFVKTYVTDKDVNIRTAAIQALSNWSSSNALTDLIYFSRTEKDDQLFNTIYNGLIRSISRSANTPEEKTLLLRDAFSIARTLPQKQAALAALQPTGTYQALVFAASYMNDPQLGGTAANVAMNIAMDNKYYGKTVRDILQQVTGKLSGSESSYLKEAVIRYLAEMPMKEGYVSLFNGHDLTGWKGLVADPIKRRAMDAKTQSAAQIKADKLMREGWSASNGELVFNGKGDNIATVKQYGDFDMLVDWKLDKNGKEGDAGIYLRGTPQVQIWDLSRTNVGAEVGSGGLYNNQKNESKPLKVADNALGEWNTFRIKMIDEHVSVWLNGQLVTDHITLENYWDRNQSIFPTEQIELQAHGTVVYYRDIFLKEYPRKEIFKLNEQEKKEGFEILFDGTNLDKWTKSDGYGISEEGYLWVYPDAKFGGNIYTKEEYGDFIYRFDFKLTPGANNGIGIHAPLEGDAAYLGKEIQVLDDTADIYKDLKSYQYHGSAYGIAAAKKGFLRPLGEWNSEEIIVKGNKIKVTLNGTVILDTNLDQVAKNGTLDGKEHPGLKRTKGYIAFLGHGSEVFFKNIRIKRIK